VADSGVRGLVIKLDGALAKIEHRDGHLICGGGARLPQVSARAATLGLAGLEFGVNIPGTVGGAVRMNANAYGGELQRVLEWVDICTAARTHRRFPEQLGFAYRRSNLGSREVVARASFSLRADDADSVKRVLADMRTQRKAAQPSGIKTFGSTFKNPDDPKAKGMTAGQLLEAAGCSGLAVGAARFSPKHSNFIENQAGRATTAEVLALMAEGRRRVQERFGVSLEPEVQMLGNAEVQ
jgi:UDP-N-acetylmuramate dehydrogenase